MPFVHSEPSRGIDKPWFCWLPQEPSEPGVRFRAALEALAYLIALGVQEHIDAGQKITRITISGGIVRSDLMGEILASVLNRPLERLVSSEGPALGAAVTALAAVETHRRRQTKIAEPFSVSDAVSALVRFRTPANPNSAWQAAYGTGLRLFAERIAQAK